MRPDQKLKALEQLAQVPGDTTLNALHDEAKRIKQILETETQYDVLEEQLTMLDAFAFRVHDTAVSIIGLLIRRLETLTLTYPDDWTHTLLDPKRYQNSETLTIKTLDVLDHLRFWVPARVLKLLLDLSIVENGNIRKKAIEGLELLVKYDLAVFYGPDRKRGFGAAPQKMVLDQIDAFEDSDLRKYQEGIIAVASGLLSPTMETTSATYKTVTWSRAAVPFHPDIIEIRQRTIALLKRLYELANSVPVKAQIIGALHIATRHHVSGSGEDVHQMIAKNTVAVLEFFKLLVASEDFPLVQKIEYESYWAFYHATDDKVREAALAIEATISKNAEYQIYKLLIGFEGIFGKWSSLNTKDMRINVIERYRQQNASRYARNITPENYQEWRQRILRFAKTESDDLATFPVFYSFLNEFAEINPTLALDLLSKDADHLQRFLIPLLRGLWDSDEKATARNVIKEWIENRKYLYQCTKLFMKNTGIDREILSLLLETARQAHDRSVLTLLVSVAVSNYSDDNQFLLTDFMLPAIEELSRLGDSSWIHDTWYRREIKQVLGKLDEPAIDTIIANALYLKKIDYHGEEILSTIAWRFPEKVLNLFGSRLKAYRNSKSVDNSVFDAVPFEFRKLNDPLAKIPAEAVRIVKGWYDGKYGSFIYEGANLLKIIFPKFAPEFQSELIKLAHTGDERNLEFVLAILRNYEGETFTHQVCKEIVRTVPKDSPLLEEVAAALESTGVVMGEFGLAEAYEIKAREMDEWAADPEEKVSDFAKKYVETLQKMSAAERKRAAEEIELRKFRFGVSNED